MKFGFPFLLLAALCGSAFADVVTIGGTGVNNSTTRDNTIFSNATGNSAGGYPGIFVGSNSAAQARRGLLAFDFSSIPAGSTINSVQLTLTVGMIAGGGSGPVTEAIDLFAVTRPWGEGVVLANTSSLGGNGNGAMAQAGNATWAQSASGTTSWTTAGGDHAATVSATNSQSVSLGGTFVWNSTAQMVADVQGWVNSPSTNNGWELQNEVESTQSFLVFYSHEGQSVTTPAQVTASQLPMLQVTFTVPEPASASLAVVAGFALLASRRSRRSPLVGRAG